MPGFFDKEECVLHTDEFWSLIERAQQTAEPQSECSMLEAMFRELIKLPEPDLLQWYDQQSAYIRLAETPKLRLAAAIVNGHWIDMPFTDFRAWLVMQGRTVYERVLADPDRLADVDFRFRDAEWGYCKHAAAFAHGWKAGWQALRADGPAMQELRARYPQHPDLETEVQRIATGYILYHWMDPDENEMPLERTALEKDVVAVLDHAGFTDELFHYKPSEENLQRQVRELAKELEIDSSEAELSVSQALPSLTEKRLAWSEQETRKGGKQHACR